MENDVKNKPATTLRSNKGILLVVSGAAGTGKGTVNASLMKNHPGYCFSVSATTRAPRPGEVDGREYHFITKEEFERAISEGNVVEYTQYCGNYYGNLKSELEKLDEGKNLILEIEVEGAMNIKKIFPECVLIFILPPSMSELERRLRKRGTETEETIAARIAQARNELQFADKFDYLVVNGELEKAVDDVNTVILAEKMNTKRSLSLLEEIKKS